MATEQFAIVDCYLISCQNESKARVSLMAEDLLPLILCDVCLHSELACLLLGHAPACYL